MIISSVEKHITIILSKKNSFIDIKYISYQSEYLFLDDIFYRRVNSSRRYQIFRKEYDHRKWIHAK